VREAGPCYGGPIGINITLTGATHFAGMDNVLHSIGELHRFEEGKSYRGRRAHRIGKKVLRPMRIGSDGDSRPRSAPGSGHHRNMATASTDLRWMD